MNSQDTIQWLRKMPYSEYLQTDHWSNIRQRTFRLQGKHCAICGRVKSLHVHHKTYKNKGCEKNEDLLVVCSRCHDRLHGIT